MGVLSFDVSAAFGVKPFEPLRKGLSGRSEGGNTGRRADWPCHIKFAGSGEFAETVRSASGRKPRMAGFIRILRGNAREHRRQQWRFGELPKTALSRPGIARWLDIEVAGSVFRPKVGRFWARNVRGRR